MSLNFPSSTCHHETVLCSLNGTFKCEHLFKNPEFANDLIPGGSNKTMKVIIKENQVGERTQQLSLPLCLSLSAMHV